MVSSRGVISFIGLMVVFGLTGCGGEQTASTSQSASTDSIARPDTELSGARIYLYDKSRVTTEIVADKIVRFQAIDSTMAYKLDIDVYDSTGRVSTHVVGDSGIIRENTGRMHIYGHVVVINEDSSKLETDYLFWDSKTDRIQTDAFVKVTRGEDVMTGWGMEADQRLNHITILKQVSGTITDIKNLPGP
jgi:LPS export ABC transporter protein LptC